ncbi:hypothetical protein BC938DRAFT_473906 [Jimgerdemannia flammicorona]|uniref:Ubiquitin-like protease family profile domain-containing protein n=1 Tax=Jimgerdemannia flammicorona TaxID=994334 RepID=A0A433Q3I8_9FUNG|nr:hypothetical protein BC938DRAFT_473906 [Jimgerdemannia flammicorona]
MRDHNNIGARLTLSATPNHDDLKAKYLRSMPERDDDEGNSDEELNRRPKTSRGRTPDNPLPKFGNHETINGEETFSHSRASDVGFVPELSRPTKLAKAMKPKMPSSNHDRQYPPSAYSSSTGSHRPSSSSTKPGLGTRSTPTVPFTASRGERRRTLFESGTHSRNDQPISDDDDDEDDSQLSSKWNPGVNASTVASGTRSVAVSANVHGKKNNDRDQDRDHEHQLRHGRQMSPTTSQPLSRDPQPSQQEFLFELTCDLKEISFGQKRFTGDKILLETIASDAKLFFRIGPKKYELFHKDIMNFQYYTSGSPPIGFLLYMKETFTIPEFREYYNPGSGNQLQKLQKVIVAIVESPKRTFDNLIGFVKHGPIIVTRLERDDWTYWLDLLETENKPPSLLEETRSQLLRRQHENNDSSRDNSASNAPLERSDVVAFESHAALYKTTRSQSPPQRETKSSHASPLLSDRTILVYPFKGVGAVTMTEEDISRLDDGEFLNDNIIEFYLKWYFDQLKMKNLELANKVHIFNSFFYKRLTQKAKSNKTENNYDRVKKWTSKVDLFRKRYIFMPVNESLHWYLVLICNPNLMLPLSSQNNPIDVDAEAAVSSTTMAESSNTSAILGDDSPIMEELQNEMEIDTASIGPDDMDVDEDHLPRAGFVQVFDQVCIPVISRNRKSKKQANGNSPADQSQQIVIDDLQAEERDEEHNLPLAKYSGVTADRNPAEPSSMVVESLPSVPKGPLFGEDDEDLELPTVAKVMGKPSKIKSRAGSPPLPSTLKKRVVKEDSSKKFAFMSTVCCLCQSFVYLSPNPINLNPMNLKMTDRRCAIFLSTGRTLSFSIHSVPDTRIYSRSSQAICNPKRMKN